MELLFSCFNKKKLKTIHKHILVTSNDSNNIILDQNDGINLSLNTVVYIKKDLLNVPYLPIYTHNDSTLLYIQNGIDLL